MDGFASPAARGMLVRLAVVVIVSTCALVATAAATLASLPSNIVNERGVRDSTAYQLAPEGWGFFTRDAREDDMLLYAVEPGGRLRNVNTGPSTDYAHRFGFDRSLRAQQAELAPILSKLPLSAFTDCNVDIETCAASLPSRGTFANPYVRHSLCGPVVVAFRPPVPWAWAHAGTDQTMPSRVARLDLTC